MKISKIAAKIGVAAAGVLVVLGFFWGNTALEVTQYRVQSSRLPEAFSGYRILQISDLHNAQFGEGNEKLITLIQQETPDMIVLTGDLIDSRNTNLPVALEFAEAMVKIAPAYYVPGNHESRIRSYGDLKQGLEAAGVSVLENNAVSITRDGAQLKLVGLQDPDFESDDLLGDKGSLLASHLSGLSLDSGDYHILLSHRPELFDTYAAAGMDLVFSGHTHGGQFRIPFLGGLVAPGQGLFPAYDAGVFQKGDTYMIVSRGVGNSIVPLRINNRPEIVVAELYS